MVEEASRHVINNLHQWEQKGGRWRALLDAAGAFFADVWACTSQDKQEQLVLQVKNKEWDGEFLDAEVEIPDKSVLRALRTGQFSQAAAGSREEVTCQFVVDIIHIYFSEVFSITTDEVTKT